MIVHPNLAITHIFFTKLTDGLLNITKSVAQTFADIFSVVHNAPSAADADNDQQHDAKYFAAAQQRLICGDERGADASSDAARMLACVRHAFTMVSLVAKALCRPVCAELVVIKARFSCRYVVLPQRKLQRRPIFRYFADCSCFLCRAIFFRKLARRLADDAVCVLPERGRAVV